MISSMSMPQRSTSRRRSCCYSGEWGSGDEYAYEALNFADGRRSVWQIAAELSAEYGGIPLDLVIEYLGALNKIGVLDKVV
jgi:hypothetical protein